MLKNYSNQPDAPLLKMSLGKRIRLFALKAIAWAINGAILLLIIGALGGLLYLLATGLSTAGF